MMIEDRDNFGNKVITLKKKIVQKFGRKVLSFGDCLDLCSDVYKATGQTLNVNTLRRFFGLVSYTNLPSQTTLNILSRYCGFGCFDHVPAGRQIGHDGIEIKDGVKRFICHLLDIDVDQVTNPEYLPMIRKALH